MERMLLTVWEAADVLSVSRSRVYELLYAEQLDFGKDRSVSAGGTRVGAALGGRSRGVLSSRRPQGEGPDGLPRLPVDRRTARPDTPSPCCSFEPSRNAGALNTAKVKTAAAAVDSASATGNHPSGRT
jgi:hypothetical protein